MTHTAERIGANAYGAVSKGERGQFMDDNRDAADSGVAHRPEKRNHDEERENLRLFL